MSRTDRGALADMQKHIPKKWLEIASVSTVDCSRVIPDSDSRSVLTTKKCTFWPAQSDYTHQTMEDWQAINYLSESGKSPSLLARLKEQVTWGSPLGWAASSSGWVPMPASARPASGLRNLLTNAIDYVQSPLVVGAGVIVVTGLAAGAWFWNNINTTAAAKVSNVEAENSRLISEIDRLTRENETMQEGSDRATQLNTEVRKI